jgi:hypothetical protein
MDKDLAALARMFKDLPHRLEANVAVAVRMGADEAANQARQHHDYIDRSGVLTNSIDSDGPTGSLGGNDLSASVSAGAPYALYVEGGTRPHKIKPRDRHVLRFPVNGGFAFAGEVNHPGTAPVLFLQHAVEHTAPRLENELIPDAVELSFIQAGF